MPTRSPISGPAHDGSRQRDARSGPGAASRSVACHLVCPQVRRAQLIVAAAAVGVQQSEMLTIILITRWAAAGTPPAETVLVGET